MEGHRLAERGGMPADLVDGTSDGWEERWLAPLQIICLCPVAHLTGTLGHKGFVRRGEGRARVKAAAGALLKHSTQAFRSLSDTCASQAPTISQSFPG